MRQARSIERLEIGGWQVARMALPKGASYHTMFTGSRSREDIGYVCVWIKGRIEGVNLTTGETLPVRQPWLVSSDLPALSVGRGKFTAVEDAEWLCFDSKINEGARAELHVLTGSEATPAGYVAYALAPGARLFVKERTA